MKVRNALFALATLAALSATPVAAQIVPGTRAPANPAEAIDDAHMIVCTLAAAGRPMGGLNIPMVGGEGYAPVDSVPDSLARFVPSVPRQKILEYPGAGGPLWIVYDQASSRCAIYAFTDPAPVEARLLRTFGQGNIWKPKKDGGPGIDHLFEWKAEPGLRLRTEISLPHAAGEPIVVAVEPARR